VLQKLYPAPKFANRIQRRNFVKEHATRNHAAPFTIYKNHRRILIIIL
jgi:hypothetical protein